MRIIVATTVVPHVLGGADLLRDWLTDELASRGHEVEDVSIPFASRPDELPSQIVGLRLMDFSDRGDRLIALRTPSHVLRHPDKTVWFLHHHRGAFDLWGSAHQDLPANPWGLGLREMLRSADSVGMGEARRLFSNSAVVRDRIERFNGLRADVLFPPVHRPERFRADEYGDFILCVCRVTAHKRQGLLVDAMRHVTTPVRLVIAGAPQEAGADAPLRRTIAEASLESRVQLMLRYVTEAEKERLVARCLAVAYVPVDEDSYGFPSLEAHHACKAVVTCTDSGGTRELIANGVNGFLVQPDPRALASAFDALWEDRERARRMGEAGLTRVTQLGITWDHAIERLLA